MKYTRKEFEREFPELHKLWEEAPMPLGLDVPYEWIEFVEYVRKGGKLG